MSGTKKKANIVLGCVFAVLAVLLVLWALFVPVGGTLIPRWTEEVDLRGRGVEKADMLLRLTDPVKIDLRENELSPEDFDVLSDAFPSCEILWDVPVAGGRYDSSGERFQIADFSMDNSGNWRYFPALEELDLRGAELSQGDYETLKSLVPGCSIIWTVPLDEGFRADSGVEAVFLENSSQTEALLSSAQYLEDIREISVGYKNISLAQYEALRAAFPESSIDYSIDIAGQTVAFNAESLDLSGMRSEDVESVIELLALLPDVKEAELMKAGGETALSIDDALKLVEAYPGIKLHYSFSLFGMELSTDMERVEYFSAKIGDSGLEELRRILPLMHALEYLRLDDCGTSDEAMARLRDDYPEIKVVWRIFMGYFSCPTDTLKVWATYDLTNALAAKLKYCTEVKYIDLGHNEKLSDFSFLEYMPELETAILAISGMEDLEPIRNCKKLNFLEIFSTNVTDLSPLAELENLEYLNISNMEIDDITPIFGLKKLKHVNCLLSHIPEDQVAEFKELFPDTYSVFSPSGDPTDFYWRYNDDGSKTERYALLTKQIGYDENDMSIYPSGYVTEEVTMEP